MNTGYVAGEAKQTVLLVGSDAWLNGEARAALATLCPGVRVSMVSSVDGALEVVREAPPTTILIAAESAAGEGSSSVPLDAAVNALAVYASVVVVGEAGASARLAALIDAGMLDYVPRSEKIAVVIDVIERHLQRARSVADTVPGVSEDWSRDFAEVLRHELNNPLTGILGNAELLLAEINRKNDGRLPQGGLERVETIAALAMRMRETVRQLSNQWETRSEAVRSGEGAQNQTATN
jgi:signal transduction histidine kinase